MKMQQARGNIYDSFETEDEGEKICSWNQIYQQIKLGIPENDHILEKEKPKIVLSTH